jgi:hypothetical protein
MKSNWYRIAKLIDKAKWRADSPMDALYTRCSMCGKWATAPENVPQGHESYQWKQPGEFDIEEQQEAQSVAKYEQNPSLGEKEGVLFSHGFCPECEAKMMEEIRERHAEPSAVTK